MQLMIICVFNVMQKIARNKCFALKDIEGVKTPFIHVLIHIFHILKYLTR